MTAQEKPTCPYLSRKGKTVFCRACDWGTTTDKTSKRVYRPVLPLKYYLCLDAYQKCPDYRYMQSIDAATAAYQERIKALQ